MGDMMEYYNQISELKKAIRERELHRLELEKEAMTKTHKREKRYDELKGKVKELQSDILREEAEASQRIQNLMSRIDAVRKEHLLLASHTERLREKKRAYEMQLANTNPSSKINPKFAPYTPNIYMGLGAVRPEIQTYNRPDFQTKIGPNTQIPTNFSQLISSSYPSGNFMGPSAGYMEKNTPVRRDMVENRALEGDILRDRAYERDGLRDRDSSSLKYMGNEESRPVERNELRDKDRQMDRDILRDGMRDSDGIRDRDSSSLKYMGNEESRPVERNELRDKDRQMDRDILRDRPLERDVLRDREMGNTDENSRLYERNPVISQGYMRKDSIGRNEEVYKPKPKVSYEDYKGIPGLYTERRENEMQRNYPLQEKPNSKVNYEHYGGVSSPEYRDGMKRGYYKDEEPEYIRRRDSEIRRSPPMPYRKSSEGIMKGDRNYMDEQRNYRDEPEYIRRESDIRRPPIQYNSEEIMKGDRNYERNYKDEQDYQRRRESEIRSPNYRENIIKGENYNYGNEQPEYIRKESEIRRSPTIQYNSEDKINISPTKSRENIMKDDYYKDEQRNYRDEQDYIRRESEIRRSPPIQYNSEDNIRKESEIRRSPIQYSPRDKNVSPTYSVKSNYQDRFSPTEKIQKPHSPQGEKYSSPTSYKSVNEEKHPYSSPLSNRRVDEEKYSGKSSPLSHRSVNEEKYSSPLSNRRVDEEKYSGKSSPLSNRSVNEEKHSYSSPLSNRLVNEEKISAYSSPLSNRRMDEEKYSRNSSPLVSHRSRVDEERNSSPLKSYSPREEKYSSATSHRKLDEEKYSSEIKSHSPIKNSSPLKSHRSVDEEKNSSPLMKHSNKPFMAPEQDDADFFDNTPATASAAYQRLVGLRGKAGSDIGTESESDGVEGSLAPQNITPKRDVKPFVSRIPSLRPGPPGTDTDSVDSVEAAIQAAMANREKDDPAPSHRSNPSKNSDINQDASLKEEKPLEKPATTKNPIKKSALNIKLESDEESYGVSVGTEASDEDDFDFYDKF